MAQRIKTYIKFQKGLDNAADKLYGFVTKSNKSWRGCNATVQKKKIVLVDPSIAQNIIPNQLYSCSLIPMRNNGGFIAQSAKLIQFKGTIITKCVDKSFNVTVTFGNKVFVYNPASKDIRKNSIKLIADELRKRMDLQNAHTVAEDFIDNACVVKRLYEQYKDHV